MRKKIKGSLTIEAAVVVPIILMVFCLIITLLFYYHDKNIVSAVTHEALVMGCGKEDIKENEIRSYINQRIGKKLIVFKNISSEVEITEQEITIICKAVENKMSLNVKGSMKKTEPEKFIWKLRRMNQMIKGEKEN